MPNSAGATVEQSGVGKTRTFFKNNAGVLVLNDVFGFRGFVIDLEPQKLLLVFDITYISFLIFSANKSNSIRIN